MGQEKLVHPSMRLVHSSVRKVIGFLFQICFRLVWVLVLFSFVIVVGLLSVALSVGLWIPSLGWSWKIWELTEEFISYLESKGFFSVLDVEVAKEK